MTEALDVAQLALLGEAFECVGEVAVFVWDDDRNYVAVNNAACKLVGLPREELLGRRVGFASVEPAVDDVQRRPFTRGGSSFRRADGQEVELEWVTMRTHVAGLSYMASVCWPRS